MALNESVNVSSEVINTVTSSLFPYLLDKLQPLMGIFKAIGIALLVWLIFMIVRSVMRIKNYRRMARMEDKLDQILSLLEKNNPRGIPSNRVKKKNK
jgi:hypothetical protein